MVDLEREELLKRIQELEQEVSVLKKKLMSGGRPPKIGSDGIRLIEQYRSEGKTVREIADKIKCSTSTVNRILRECRKKSTGTEKVEKSDIIPPIKTEPIELTKPAIESIDNINRLKQSVIEARNNLNIASPKFIVTNATSKKDLVNMISAVVSDNINIEVYEFSKNLATTTSDGVILAGVKLIDDEERKSENVNLRCVIKVEIEK